MKTLMLSSLLLLIIMVVVSETIQLEKSNQALVSGNYKQVQRTVVTTRGIASISEETEPQIYFIPASQNK